MTELAIAAIGCSAAALGAGLWALRRAARAETALAAERVERLSAAEASEAAARLGAARVEAIEQRVGRGRRLTRAKRERALELLAFGASEHAVARELDMRQSEVCVLADLRNRVGD